MYLNVLSFKNGKTLAFQSEIPFSMDKVNEGWNIVTDEVNGQILSFKGSELVTIANAPVKEDKPDKPVRKPRVVTKVTSE